MTDEGRKFLLDANVFIAAHRQYYAFDLCPGFWNSLQEGSQRGRIFSTQRVLAELQRARDPLQAWVDGQLPADFFVDDSSPPVANAFGPMMAWVAGRNYTLAAQTKFATDADGWLIAAAKQAGYCLVTHEIRGESPGRVKMPNVCEAFGVSYCNTFDMLRELMCQFC